MFLAKPKSKLKLIPASLLARPSLSRILYQIGRIGTQYGGWCFAPTPLLMNSEVVFCGAVEDVSFGIGFAA